ncbi:MAG: non-heme iron oxygenase ferredoxin subunit [Thermomicrobiales bacterium]
MTETYYAVGKTADLGPGELRYVEVGPKEEPVCLINMGGEYFALDDCCTHQDASLSDGEIQGDEIECPLHGGSFEIRTGQPTSFPVVVAAKTYKVRVEGDEIQIAIAGK